MNPKPFQTSVHHGKFLLFSHTCCDNCISMQPAYHSKLCENPSIFQEACGCSLCPLKSEIRGPADSCPADQEDIIDETLFFFRANTFFRNFDVRSGPDKTMIYLTLFAQQCLVKCERIEDRNSGAVLWGVLIWSVWTSLIAIKELRAMATKQFVIPGENGWPLGTLFAAPANRQEAGK